MDSEKMQDLSKPCPVCGKTFYGRSDKKFCSSKCKNEYHNEERYKTQRIKNRILGDLNSNYRILNELIESKTKEAEVGDLSSIGFNPSIVTGFGKTTGGENVLRCFDIKYSMSDTRIYNLKKQSVTRKFK